MLYVALALTVLLLTSLYVNWIMLKDDVDMTINASMPTYSQSEVHQMQKMHDNSFRETKEEEEKPFVRVAIYDGKAYWVGQEGLFTAPLDEEEEVEYDLKQLVDAHSMNQQELDTMLEILDALKEDDYEDRN